MVDDHLLPKHRVEALCDGIFAIVMTIMILELKTPENLPKDMAQKDLPEYFFNLLPSIEAYIISFFVLGIFWLRHQIQFKHIVNVDRPILIINISFLMLTGFIPFTVGVLMKYPRSEFTFLIYVTNLILISILLTIQLKYIFTKKNISAETISETDKRRYLKLSFIPVLIFILAIIVSYFNVRAAFYIIYLDPIFYAFYHKFNLRYRKN
ncbi:MAG TPA: TMEM175 family protein [Ignavibacteria bacterium]|nr:hypothetical protein [Bacteroidota bacterium]HRI84148.1 TMEM175 family protein [Ignavibacteria bacterium]HRJ98816.1 TMEM175 family protein [Ignavibacteria bacterium]